MTRDDRLDELRDHLRVVRDSAAAAIPSQGWAGSREHEQPNVDEAEALLKALQALRELVPDELQEQLRETIRQVLLLVRALIDLALSRVEAGSAEHARDAEPAVEAQDIPIS